MLALTFKQKLVLSMMVVVSGITLAILLVAERKLQQSYEARFQQQFNSGLELFNARQEVGIGGLKTSAANLTANVRFTSLLDEAVNDPDPQTTRLLYNVITNQMGISGLDARRVEIIRAYDPQGRLIAHDTSATDSKVDQALERIAGAIAGPTETELGYLAIPEAQEPHRLYRVLTAKQIDTEEEELRGTLLFGMPFAEEKKQKEAIYGLWVEGRLRLSDVAAADQATVRAAMDKAARPEGRTNIVFEGKLHSLFYRQLNPGSHFPRAYHVSLQPLAPMLAEQRDLRLKVALAGSLALAAALAISLVLAGGLTAPIERLAAATHEIERGNFEVKLPVQTADEVGRLTESFNDMAAGLLLREKYRSVLDMVADKKIAEDLIHGQIELGGEERQVSVLFCDIRGFTALTEHMEPKEVIEMLNQHFTPLTRIVYDHHGAVDKFVGDLIMAIFGAPKGFGNDLENAARCALKMIEERRRLNETGKYKIEIGIGVASGNVVAGRMGSKDRLNYTVLGPRVNLASRLCSKAGRMEVVIDDLTFRSIEQRAIVSPTPELQLKGFAAPVQAYKLEKFLSDNESAKREMVAA